MLYYALHTEIKLREPKLLRFIGTNTLLKQICGFFLAVDEVIQARSRSKLNELLRQLYDVDVGGANLQHSRCALREEESRGQDDVQLHSLLGPDEYFCPILQITVINLDNSSSCTYDYYTDTTLGWLVNRSSEYFKLGKKCFRVVHNNRSLFLSSSRKRPFPNWASTTRTRWRSETLTALRTATTLPLPRSSTNLNHGRRKRAKFGGSGSARQ